MKRSVMRIFTNIHVVLVLTGLIPIQFITTAFAVQEQVSISHEGTAVVKVVDMNKGIIKLAHGPIASLKWPAMTMDFKVKESTLLQGIKVNDSVTFTFIQSNGDYVVTRIQSSK